MSTKEIQDLQKALEAGSYNAAPSTLTQGSSLQVEDLDAVMTNVSFQEKSLKLAKTLGKQTARGTLIQFNRQLSYGTLGGSAQYEGGIGEETNSDFARAVVPMAYYSKTKRTTVAANMVATMDGVKAEDRVAMDAAKEIAADIEFDSFRGQSDFSNAGVFDGNPLAAPKLPGIHGVDVQVRLSDSQASTQDQMLAAYGANQSVVTPVNGQLTQSIIEDAAVKSALNHGEADVLYLALDALSNYNKLAQAKERIMLAGSAQDATGANLRKQWTSSGDVSIESSRFLSGKEAPIRAKANTAAAPAIVAANAADAASNLSAGVYKYFVTATNESGEGLSSAEATATVGAGDKATVTITAVASAKYYSVYRSVAGGSIKTAKFVGNVKDAGVASTVFTDLGNRIPGSSTGFLIQKDSMQFHELAPFSTQDLAITNLSIPKAFFQFTTLAVKAPKFNILLENIA